MQEPLLHFYEIHGFDSKRVEKLVIGEIYTALKLTDGSIGVCSNLHEPIENPDLEKFPDLSNFSHRIIYNAYLNALLNYNDHCCQNSDIFDVVDFEKYQNIVMIGYFKPLVEKLDPVNIDVKIFDLFADDERVYPIEKQSDFIPEADALILTATSLSNNTFVDLISQTGDNCDIFLLGPSTPLSGEFFKYRNIKSVFGMQFDLHDDRVLETIGNGMGTRTFSKLGRKVVLQNKRK